MSRLRLFAGAGLFLLVHWLHAQEVIHEVRWSREQFAFPQLSAPTLIEVPASESSGFFFPYYLYIPKNLSRSKPVRVLIEPNNTWSSHRRFRSPSGNREAVRDGR